MSKLKKKSLNFPVFFWKKLKNTVKRPSVLLNGRIQGKDFQVQPPPTFFFKYVEIHPR